MHANQLQEAYAVFHGHAILCWDSGSVKYVSLLRSRQCNHRFHSQRVQTFAGVNSPLCYDMQNKQAQPLRLCLHVLELHQLGKKQ